MPGLGAGGAGAAAEGDGRWTETDDFGRGAGAAGGMAAFGAVGEADAGAGAAAMTGAPGLAAGPLGGKVGNLIVAEAVGFGGKLMRTVSFFGCTLAASAGLGGRPLGKLGFSAIIFFKK